MRPHKRIARLFGYELIRIEKQPTLDLHLARMLARLNVDLVLDVGANRGRYGALLRTLGYRGEILSFEPIPSVYKSLSTACAKDDGWSAVKSAMGAAAGTRTINVAKASKFSSFYETSQYGTEAFEGEIDLSRTEQVEVTTIDAFLRDKGQGADKRRIFLKIDTQGHDLEVFMGARNSLKSIVGIQSEISFNPIYAGMPGYLETLKTYEEYGFKVTGLYPIGRDNKNLSIIEMDCVLVNTREVFLGKE